MRGVENVLDRKEEYYIDLNSPEQMQGIARQFVDSFPNNNPKNLVFVGNVGKGKTFLAECIASEVMQKNFYVDYVRVYK